MSLCLRPPLLAFIQFVHLFVATASFQLVLPISNTKWPQPSTTIRRQTKESDESSSSIFADDADNKSTNNLIETCPFSKSFGRYQVDLTSSSKFQKKEEGGFRLFPFQKSISETVSRSKLQQQLSSNKEEFIWIQDLDGVAAFAFLWERAAYLLHEDKAISTSEVIALPDASPSVVQNWIEIVEWMNGQLELIPSGASTILASSMMENQSVPAVRIQRVGSTGSASNEISSARPTKFSSEQVISGTRSWVRRILVDEGICPFTKSDRKSGQGLSDVGVPVGGILYSTSFAKNAIQLQADTWKTILEMIEAGPGGKSGISSILLAAPSFDEDFDIWAGPIFAMLEAGVVAAQALQQVGVVCFHPLYATPDGTSWPGFGHMHSVPRLQKWYNENNKMATGDDTTDTAPTLTTEEVAAGGAWQRRTPHATINVLRADQLEAAESRRTTGLLYAENIEKLVGRKSGIGSTKLARDLIEEQRIGMDGNCKAIENQ